MVNVIGSKQPRWPGPLAKTTVHGYPLRWAPGLVDAINAVHAEGLADVQWASTWSAEGWHDDLTAGTGLGPFKAAVAPGTYAVSVAKRVAAQALVATGRRLVWTDDEVVPARAADRISLLGPGSGESWLTIRPAPSRGLNPADLAQVRAFLTRKVN